MCLDGIIQDTVHLDLRPLLSLRSQQKNCCGGANVRQTKALKMKRGRHQVCGDNPSVLKLPVIFVAGNLLPVSKLPVST